MMTPGQVRCCVWAAFATASLAVAQARTVQLNEVQLAQADQWIELHNPTSQARDISLWTLYLATRTPNAPQTYFYGFPAGTVVPAGGFLRVHWLQPAPGGPQPGELWTGNTIFDFLFGLGAEPLPADGALALIRSQSNGQMNTAALFEDWVSWGGGNHRREDLAAQNGRWVQGRFVEAPAGGDSLARVESVVGLAALPDLEWFQDASPTPLLPNSQGMSTTSIGAGCAAPGNHLFGPPELLLRSFPIPGNRRFGLEIANTSGLLGEFAIVVFSTQPAPTGQPALLPPIAGPGCPEHLHYGHVAGTLVVPTLAGVTTLPLSLANVAPGLQGLRLLVQAVILDGFSVFPPYQGATNAVDFTLG